MTARLTESAMYRHLWGTAEVRAIFSDQGRLASWLHILSALADAQAELGLVPTAAAASIRRHAQVERLDLDFLEAETRRTGHSMLGLIRALRRALPVEAREHVYKGATVQDVTDTWTALAIRQVGAVAWRDLRTIESRILELADQHRDTLMSGRTHGQIGAPITFGWKVSSWADEVHRHLDRLREGSRRWVVGQLGGALGTGAFFGPDALQLRRRFCERLELADPGISWLSARDRIAEFGTVLALVTGTLGRIGNEIYALARTEVRELHEPADPDAVSSITMPHKRNPERSEHLVTLARLVSAQAHILVDGQVHEHERDGRPWKAEWVAFPEACLLTSTALTTAVQLLDGLEVDGARMADNAARHQSELASERLLGVLADKVGKHAAQRLMHQQLGATQAAGAPAAQSLYEAPAIRAHLPEEDIRSLLDASLDVGAASVTVDLVRDRLMAARAEYPERWP